MNNVEETDLSECTNMQGEVIDEEDLKSCLNLKGVKEMKKEVLKEQKNTGYIISGELSDLPFGTFELNTPVSLKSKERMYILQKICQDTDDYARLEIISLHKTVEGAREKAKWITVDDFTISSLTTLPYDDMTLENGYTHIGDGEDLVFVDADFNGFLITEMIVED